MKAITLTQPWASLVACGAKRIETRGWRTNYDGRIAIHAAKGFPGEARRLCEARMVREALGIPQGVKVASTLPVGAVIATVEVIKCMSTEMVSGLAPGASIHSHGLEWIISPQELAFGNYDPGRWAWLLADVKTFDPQPAKGALSLWEWNR